MASDSLEKVVDDSACFVCGRDNPIGLKIKLTVDKDENTSFACVTLSEFFQGWKGVVHGGILATLLDEACAYACMTKAPQCVTAEMKVRYRKPVQIDQAFELSGQLIDSQKKVWLARAQIRVNGSLHAEAEAKMFILDQE